MEPKGFLLVLVAPKAGGGWSFRLLDCRTVEEWSPSPTCSKSAMMLVEAESSSVSRETLSAVARRRSTPAVPMLLYLVGDVSAVAGPIPMGVSTKSIVSPRPGWSRIILNFRSRTSSSSCMDGTSPAIAPGSLHLKAGSFSGGLGFGTGSNQYRHIIH